MIKRVNRNNVTAIAKSYHESLKYLALYKDKQDLFDTLVAKLADMLQRDNKRFNRDRFYKAVSGEESLCH